MPYTLLVEDNNAHALLFERCLRKIPHDFSVQQVHDGQSALDFLKAKSLQKDLPSLVFLDLRIPKLSGFEVLRSMREVPHLRSVPVVVLSTSDRPSDIRLSREYGATDYWLKPVSTETLKRCLDEFSLCEE